MKPKHFLFIFYLMLPCLIMAQTISIKGRIVDENGTLITNAVIIKIKEAQYISAADGFFEMQLQANEVVAFSATGKVSQKKLFSNSSSNLTITLSGNKMAEVPDTTSTKCQKPEYPGGIKELARFFAKNLNYPLTNSTERQYKIVLASITIEKDGSVTNARIINSPCDSLSQEALRVIYLMPHWKPAYQAGHPIAYTLKLPILFKLPTNNTTFKQATPPIVLFKGHNTDSLKQFLNNKNITPRRYVLNQRLSSADKVLNLSEPFTACVIRYTDYIQNVSYICVIVNTWEYLDERTEILQNGLYIIDGKESSRSALKKIKPKQINQLRVITRQNAIERYGDKGRNGVVEINTKSVSDPMIVKPQTAIVVFRCHQMDTLKLYLTRNKISPDSYMLNNKITPENDIPDHFAEMIYISVTKNINRTSGNPFYRVYISTESNSNLVRSVINEGLYIVNGKETPATEGRNISVEERKTFRLMLPEEAITKYGDKGKKGVIEITLKEIK